MRKRKIRKNLLTGLLIILTIMTTILQPITNQAADLNTSADFQSEEVTEQINEEEMTESGPIEESEKEELLENPAVEELDYLESEKTDTMETVITDSKKESIQEEAVLLTAAYTAPGQLYVKDTSDRAGGWDIPVLNYIYSSKIGSQVYNYVKYIVDDAANGWRLAYCTQLTKHFEDSTTYISQTWQANGMYSEISWVLAHGCKKYAQKNESAYSTGNWIRDYYVTQTVIYCILADYGYDGHLWNTLSAVSGYEDVYNCSKKMYQAVKANAGKDGYGDTPSYTIIEPQNIMMQLSGNGEYYESGWYSIACVGELVNRSIELSEAPEGCEIVYENENNLTSRFYIRIPVKKANEVIEDETSFKVKATAKFNRPFIYIYQSKIADKQNITFQEESIQPAPESNEARASIKLVRCNIVLDKKDKESENGVEGAVYGIYADEACTELVGQMPVTDRNGHTEMQVINKYRAVYIKEITAPTGYLLNSSIEKVDVTADQTSNVIVWEQQVKGRIRVQKKAAETEIDAVQGDGTIVGAEYGLYAKADIIHPDGQTGIVYKAGELVAKAITDENGIFEFGNLYLGNYFIKEIKNPAGYLLSDEEYPVNLVYEDQYMSEVMETLEVSDEATFVEFSKTSITTGKELPGCKLKVLNEDEQVIDEWISTETPHVIKALTAGRKYTLVETQPADGYVTAESIEFEVNESGEIQKVAMNDEVTKVEISKQDIGGKELPGAKLSIFDEEGKELESWVSGAEPHYVEMLSIGKYTLHEEAAPNGYLIANDLKFEVLDRAEIQRVLMVDEKEEKKTESNKKKPSTGDVDTTALWFMLLGVGSAQILALLLKRNHFKK